MNVSWEVDSDDDNNDFDIETSQFQELNFTLMIMIEDISSGVDRETIIGSKNITDPIIIDILRKIMDTTKGKTQEDNKVSTSTSNEIIKPPLLTSTKEVNKVTPPTSSLEISMVSIIPNSNNDMRVQISLLLCHHDAITMSLN
jgi:hypothetical protein